MTSLIETMLPGLLSQPVQLLEVTLAVTVALVLRWRPGGLAPFGTLWRWLERRPVPVLAGIAACLLTTHIALEWHQPRRAPAVHDEFAYLLTAETFLDGRLTNSTPPAWRALDTIHVNFEPSYNSMYPPGQPLLLAAAWRGLGEPVYANWVVAPLIGLASWWMLAGWMPRRMALLGGCLVALRLGAFGYWAESYMSGALPAICALVFGGALPRFLRRPSIALGVAVGLALGAMFSCRPFEAVALGVCSIPMPWLVRSTTGARTLLGRGLPGLVLFALVIGAVAMYNAALTGNPLRFGYDLNMERHGYGVFPGSRVTGTEADTTPHMAVFYDETRAYAAYGWTVPGFIGTRLRASTWSWVFLVGPFLSLGWLHWRGSLRVGRLQAALPGLLSFWVLVAAQPWSFPHYYSGALGFLVLFALTGLRLWCVRHRVPSAALAGALFTAAAATVVVRAVGGAAMLAPPSFPIDWLPYHTPAGLEDRRAFDRDAGAPGPALVLVRYGPHESVRRDWVYNHADPSRSRVVWANDLGPTANAVTVRAYAGRQTICLTLEGGRPRRADCASWISP